MANIRVDINHTPRDGETVTFKAPCDAKEITGLVLYYVDNDEATKSRHFTLSDANGGDIGVLENIFSAGALVKVLLDTGEGKAFMQNADTNAYLEGRFEELEDAISTLEPGTTDYNKLENKPVIPSSVSAVEHQYTVSNSKDNVSDVTTWNSATNPLTQRQRACVYGNGYYVVCGTSGEIAYSLDGEAWTSIAKFTTDVITGIAYGKGLFAAIDSGGLIWIANETPFAWEPLSVEWKLVGAGTTVILEGICYANNRFVLVGEPNLVAFSDDGKTWTETSVPYNFKTVTFGNGRYVGAGNGGAVAVSYDGENWTDYSDPTITGSYRAAAFGKNRYVIGCQAGIIRYSDDGRTWHTATTNSTSTVNYIRGIVYSEGKFYAVMYVSTGKGEIWVSEDAETWTVQQVASGRLWCCAAGDGIIVASGDNGAIYVLDFGIDWQTKQPELTEGQYMWERIVFTLSDGGMVVGDGVCIKAFQKTKTWTFTLEGGGTVTEEVYVK